MKIRRKIENLNKQTWKLKNWKLDKMKTKTNKKRKLQKWKLEEKFKI